MTAAVDMLDAHLEDRWSVVERWAKAELEVEAAETEWNPLQMHTSGERCKKAAATLAAARLALLAAVRDTDGKAEQ